MGRLWALLGCPWELLKHPGGIPGRSSVPLGCLPDASESSGKAFQANFDGFARSRGRPRNNSPSRLALGVLTFPEELVADARPPRFRGEAAEQPRLLGRFRGFS